MTTFKVKDIRNQDAFPNLSYRFSNLRETETDVILEKDYLGENPLHYYIDTKAAELIVANNITDIKDYLEHTQRTFTWERVRAVSNNTRVTLDDLAFDSATPKEEEIEPALQEYELQKAIDYIDINVVGRAIRGLLQSSLEARLASIQEPNIGLLLSGGLDSMGIGYLLSKIKAKDVTAFTLKADETEPDVVKSRELAKRFQISLVEVKITETESGLSITSERYSPSGDLIYSKKIAKNIIPENAVLESLRISGNPKKDNLFCAVAMYLIAQAIKGEGIQTVFCGEGPNEMINDYGFNPRESGYSSDNKGDVRFREALTFGLKKTDRQLGRGGLPKHATARMGKIFAHYGLRLESPYFDKDIARIMTRIPHLTSYDTIKQHIVSAIFPDDRLDSFIQGTSKQKFQDGSGISRLFRSYTQERLIDMFEGLYGIRKTAY